jgi:hypothetical protein
VRRSKWGLVESLARPGGNVTGLSNMEAELGGKRLDLLREAIPGLVRVAAGLFASVALAGATGAAHAQSAQEFVKRSRWHRPAKKYLVARLKPTS